MTARRRRGVSGGCQARTPAVADSAKINVQAGPKSQSGGARTA
jgi:hypothetical protein